MLPTRGGGDGRCDHHPEKAGYALTKVEKDGEAPRGRFELPSPCGHKLSRLAPYRSGPPRPSLAPYRVIEFKTVGPSSLVQPSRLFYNDGERHELSGALENGAPTARPDLHAADLHFRSPLRHAFNKASGLQSRERMTKERPKEAQSAESRTDLVQPSGEDRGTVTLPCADLTCPCRVLRLDGPKRRP